MITHGQVFSIELRRQLSPEALKRMVLGAGHHLRR